MLTRAELRSLVAAFAEACRFIADLKARCPVAEHLQYPKVPSILSESIAGHAIREGKLLSSVGPFSSVDRGGKTADLLATPCDGGELCIEIKASGEKEFVTFGKKDYGADYLIWLLFGKSLQQGTLGKTRVLICPRPGDHLPGKKNRVTAAALQSTWDGEIVPEYIDLQELLGE